MVQRLLFSIGGLLFATSLWAESEPICRAVIRHKGIWEARIIQLPGALHDAFISKSHQPGQDQIEVQYGDSAYEPYSRTLTFENQTHEFKSEMNEGSKLESFVSPLHTLEAQFEVETRQLNIKDARSGTLLNFRNLVGILSPREFLDPRVPFRPRFYFSMDDSQLMLVTPYKVVPLNTWDSTQLGTLEYPTGGIRGADFVGNTPAIFANGLLLPQMDLNRGTITNFDKLNEQIRGAVSTGTFYADGRDYFAAAIPRNGDSYIHLFRFDYKGFEHSRVRFAHHPQNAPFTWMKITPRGVLTYSSKSRLLIHHNSSELDPEGD